jgi:hypothetical protein
MPEPVKGYAKKRMKLRRPPSEPGQSVNFRMWVENGYGRANIVCQSCGRTVAVLRRNPGDILEALKAHRCR